MSSVTNALRVLFRGNGRPFVWGVLTAEDPFSAPRALFMGTCSVGVYTVINGTVHIHDADIGRYCSIAHGAVIGALKHRTDRLGTHALSGGEPDRPHERVTIGNDVWIGTNAVVMPGITIGDGAVVGAGAVVTRDVAPYAIATGVPARVSRYRFDEPTIRRLLQVRWWRLNIGGLRDKRMPEALAVLATHPPPLLDPATVRLTGRLPPELAEN